MNRYLKLLCLFAIVNTAWAAKPKRQCKLESLQTEIAMVNSIQQKSPILRQSTGPDLNIVSGEWVLYPKGSDQKLLIQSLKERNIDGFKVSEISFRAQLNQGDFYVYYSHNKAGQAVEPRITINMDEYGIAKTRGFAKDRNLDPIIARQQILSNKLKEFGSKAGPDLNIVSGEWVLYPKGSDQKMLIQSLKKRNIDGSMISEISLRAQLNQCDFYVYYSHNNAGQAVEPRITFSMGEYGIPKIEGFAKDRNLDPIIASQQILSNKLKEFGNKAGSDLNIVSGEWVKYPKGPDHQELLWQSLKERNIDSSMASEIASRSWAKQGDFYVYYSHNNAAGEAVVPRITIKMDEHGIDKIEGFAEEIGTFIKVRNLDPIISRQEILGNKLKEFGSKAETRLEHLTYTKRVNVIEDKHNAGEELTQEELRLLYDIDPKWEPHIYSYGKDPRIDVLIKQRSKYKRQDIAKAVNLRADQVSTNQAEFNPDVVYHYGNLEITLNGEALALQHVTGDFKTNSKSAKGLEQLKTIGLDAHFTKLTDARGLSSLQSIRDAYFPELTNSKGLTSLQTIRLNAHFPKLTDSRGLSSLQKIGMDAHFPELTNSKGLSSLEVIGRDANLDSMTDATGLISLQSIGRNAKCRSLTNSKGLRSLQVVGGHAYFNKLTDTKDLISLREVFSAYFNSITTAEGLISLKYIGGEAHFYRLTDAKGLSSLYSIGLDARFDSLTDARGLSSLYRIGADAYFNKLTDTKDLISLREVEKNTYLKETR